jgi:hypothetical protein
MLGMRLSRMLSHYFLKGSRSASRTSMNTARELNPITAKLGLVRDIRGVSIYLTLYSQKCYLIPEIKES